MNIEELYNEIKKIDENAKFECKEDEEDETKVYYLTFRNCDYKYCLLTYSTVDNYYSLIEYLGKRGRGFGHSKNPELILKLVKLLKEIADEQ